MSLCKDITSAINANNAENESDTPDFILGEFASDALGAVNKAIKRRDEWYEDRRRADIAGALFDFVGFLTTLPEPLTVGATNNTSEVLRHLVAWSLERGIALNTANVETWNKGLSKTEDGS